MSDEQDAQSVGPWAAAKLERLGKYLNAYTQILKQQHRWCQGYIYVDAFAGAGDYTLRPSSRTGSLGPLLSGIAEFASGSAEQRELIKGSARVALEIKQPFTQYVFVERDPERIGLLQQLRKEYPQQNVSIQRGDCNAYLRQDFLLKFNWSKWRAVVFLDPFGMQVPWATLEELGRTGGVEVFLNFPVGMAIQPEFPFWPRRRG